MPNPSLNSYCFWLALYLIELLWPNAVIEEQISTVVSGKMRVRALKLLVINLADTGFPKCQ